MLPPPLEPGFRPAALANRAFAAEASVPVRIALEQADGSVFRFETGALPDGHPQASGNFTHLERMLKFLLWSRGGHRIYFRGPKPLGEALQKYYRESATGKFDSEIVGRGNSLMIAVAPRAAASNT